MSIALALGQIEEGIGMLEDYPGRPPGLYQVLERTRNFLLQAAAADAARVPLALYTPITAEEVGKLYLELAVVDYTPIAAEEVERNS